VQPGIYIRAQTENTTGLAFRRKNTALLVAINPAASHVPAGSSNAIALSPDGSAVVSTEWRLPATSAACASNTCATATVVVPSVYLEDNVSLQSRLRDAPTGVEVDLRWFLRNNWHQLAFVAVAPSLVAGGAGTCSAMPPVTCLQVANLSPASKQRAILLLAGRGLNGAARPSANLGDYLDTAENRNGDTVFERLQVGTGFNDRFVVVDANP
jgi:hypothetical protein